jgi:hypothetical protein
VAIAAARDTTLLLNVPAWTSRPPADRSKCWAPPGDSREVMTSSRTRTTPESVQRRRSSRSQPGDATPAPAGALHGLDQHAPEVRVDEQGVEAGRLVERRDDEPVRHRHRRRAVVERQDPAVVAALEHPHARPAGVVQRRRDGHEVRLGPRVREPHPGHRREACGDQLGQLDLTRVHRPHGPAAVEGLVHGPAHGRRVVTSRPAV